MVTWVLDTSVVAKWFLQEEGTDRAEPYLLALLNGEGRIAAPASLYFEMANVLWTHRKDGLSEERTQAIWLELAELPIEIIQGPKLLPRALRFSYEHDVSPYDSAFIVLAQQLGCDLITADGKLWRKVHEACPWAKLL